MTIAGTDEEDIDRGLYRFQPAAGEPHMVRLQRLREHGRANVSARLPGIPKGIGPPQRGLEDLPSGLGTVLDRADGDSVGVLLREALNPLRKRLQRAEVKFRHRNLFLRPCIRNDAWAQGRVDWGATALPELLTCGGYCRRYEQPPAIPAAEGGRGARLANRRAADSRTPRARLRSRGWHRGATNRRPSLVTRPVTSPGRRL
jgi:hypothetical protein